MLKITFTEEFKKRNLSYAEFRENSRNLFQNEKRNIYGKCLMGKKDWVGCIWRVVHATFVLSVQGLMMSLAEILKKDVTLWNQLGPMSLILSGTSLTLRPNGLVKSQNPIIIFSSMLYCTRIFLFFTFPIFFGTMMVFWIFILFLFYF